jgi:hypothetical protein
VLDIGEVWSCTVQPPLPYAVQFRVTIAEVDPGAKVAATIDGDIAGSAELRLSGAPSGSSRLRLVADLGPRKRSMQALSIVARPLVTFGHHWVLDTGARQFAAGLGGPSSGQLEDDPDAE